MQIEKYIYKYAVRMSYANLLKENPKFIHIPIADIEIVLFTLNVLVENDDFENFDVVWQLIDEICKDNAETAETFQQERLVVYLKFMHILETVGKDAVEKVIEKMDSYFKTTPAPIDASTSGKQQLSPILLNSYAKECRQYLLRILAIDERRRHFCEEKLFPQTFEDFVVATKNIIRRAVEGIRNNLPVCELETLNRCEDLNELECGKDPSVLLFREKFAAGSELTEHDLCTFMKLLNHSQLTVTQPTFVKQVPAEDICEICGKMFVSLKISNCNVATKRRKRKKDFPVLVSANNAEKSHDASDELFPSLERIMSPKKGSLATKQIRPCRVDLIRMSEADIREFCTALSSDE